MARKKPEIEQALHGPAYQFTQDERDARLALELRELTEQALAGLDEKGLARMPDEPVAEWHGRLRVWLTQNAGFKRFGSAGSRHE